MYPYLSRKEDLASTEKDVEQKLFLRHSKYAYIYLFVCSELIEETGRFPIVIFGI